MAVKTMTASHATGKGKPDASFSSAGKGKVAIAKYGKENVVDATLGVLKDDNGDFLTLKGVEKIYRNLPGKDVYKRQAETCFPDPWKTAVPCGRR